MKLTLKFFTTILFSGLLVVANTLLFAKEISFTHQHTEQHSTSGDDHQTSEYKHNHNQHCDRYPEACSDHSSHAHTVCFVACSFVWFNQKSDLELNLVSFDPIFPVRNTLLIESNFQSSIFRPPI
jgi:hypothetical protein